MKHRNPRHRTTHHKPISTVIALALFAFVFACGAVAYALSIDSVWNCPPTMADEEFIPIREELAYEPTFWCLQESRAATPQQYGFTGRNHDAFSERIHFRHRQYNPNTGRFDGSDPAGYDSNPWGNLYAYASNRPTHFVDPFGLWSSKAHEKLTEEAVDATGCTNVCADQMAKANSGVDGGVMDAMAWLLVPNYIPNPDSAAPHYMAANNLLGGADKYAARARADKVIEDHIKQAHIYARAGDCENGAVALGKALHTIQDKYSHTDKKGLPITDRDHILIRGGIDNPDINPIRFRGAKLETDSVVQEYVDILTTEGCHPCKK